MALSQCLLLLTFLLVLSTASKTVKPCVDGVNNLVHLKDELKGKGAIHFRDVSVRTYDLRKRPRCHEGKASFKFPGHIKFDIGEIEISKAVRNSDSPIHLQLTLEKNSFIVGTVCDKGVSRNQYVPNEVCSLEICRLNEDFCRLLEKKAVLTLPDLPALLHDFIDIGPMALPQVAVSSPQVLNSVKGEWALALRLEQAGKVLAHLSITRKGEWLNIETDNEEKPTKEEEEELAREREQEKEKEKEKESSEERDEL